jgi:hypothetical protein
MPVLIRRDFAAHEETMLRAFLGQPIIFYGHSSAFSHGLGFLEHAARAINRLPGVFLIGHVEVVPVVLPRTP